MTQIVKSTQTGLVRIFKRFTRTTRTPLPGQRRWYETDLAARGL